MRARPPGSAASGVAVRIVMYAAPLFTGNTKLPTKVAPASSCRVSPATAPSIAACRSPLAGTRIVRAPGVSPLDGLVGVGAVLGGGAGGVHGWRRAPGCGAPFKDIAGSPKKIHDRRTSGFVTTR